MKLLTAEGLYRASMSTNPLDSVVLQKEKEWREAFQLRVKALEESVVLKEKKLKQEKLRFLKLKEDFEYNLKLLVERDEELEKYDAVIGRVKEAEHVKTAEVSELFVKIDELKIKLENEQKAKEELQKHYQKRLQEYQNELKAFRELKDNEVAKEREELFSFRRNLESQLREAEHNFEFCRQELVSNFDEEMRKREQEYRAKLDETSSLLLSNDLKIRSLSKELELVRSDSGRCKAELNKNELSTRELEKMVKEKDWIIADLENTHQYKMTDLEMQMENMKKDGQKLQEDFQRKHAELDRVVREKQEMLTNAKQGYAEDERQLRQKIRDLQGQLESKNQEYRQKEWRFVDRQKENDVTVQKLQQTISELKEKLDKESEEYSRRTVAKDVELETLHQQEAKIRSELAQRKDDLERRQNELTLSLEREASLERSTVQLELDWQRRCEDAERTGYEKQEELVKNLTQGKEEALSLVKQQKRELLHQDSVIRILTTQRDESFATLKHHGLSVPPQIPHKTEENLTKTEKETVELQVQNENLLQIIHQMRKDMEDLTKQLSQRTADSATNTKSGVPITEEYVASLEKEIREIKAKNRELIHSLANTENKTSKASEVVGKNDPHVKSLVMQLNETIGSLRQEKLDLTSEVRKYEATVMHLQSLLHQSNEEVRQKQVNIDQLQYQLTREHRRTEEEMNALKKRNSDLTLQVTQARHEADEFYKTGLERNIDAVALGNQLSTLKLDLASKGKRVDSYNPVRFMQELQDENQRLKKQLGNDSSRSIALQSCEILHGKLRKAAQRINELTKEREKLIKMGNKLRAELLKYKGNTNATSDDTSQLSSGQVNIPSRSNLRGLEQLQYQLTSRELQYAQQTLAKHTEQIPREITANQLPLPSSQPGETPGLQVSAKIHDDIISPWQPSFSSDDRSSLQEVWKLLDEDSPGFTPREIHEVRGSHARERSSTPDSFTVKGQPSHVQVKPQTTKPALSAKAAGKWKPAQAKVKVRNYNMRDEDIREGL